jgi:hypothetical protein
MSSELNQGHKREFFGLPISLKDDVAALRRIRRRADYNSFADLDFRMQGEQISSDVVYGNRNNS